MTVKDLWNMWGDLHEKTYVNIYTSGGDLLEVNQLFYKVFPKYENCKVYTFSSAVFYPYHKVITIEV